MTKKEIKELHKRVNAKKDFCKSYIEDTTPPFTIEYTALIDFFIHQLSHIEMRLDKIESKIKTTNSEL